MSGDLSKVKAFYSVPTPMRNVRRFGWNAIKKENHADNIYVTLSTTERANLDALATLLNCSRSYIIRWLVTAMSQQVLKDAGLRYYEWDDIADGLNARSQAERSGS